jgi:hypothetical protein
VIVERRGELGRGGGATIPLHEPLPKERKDQARVAGTQQAPGGMTLAQRLDPLEVHHHSLDIGSDIVDRTAQQRSAAVDAAATRASDVAALAGGVARQPLRPPIWIRWVQAPL